MEGRGEGEERKMGKGGGGKDGAGRRVERREDGREKGRREDGGEKGRREDGGEKGRREDGREKGRGRRTGRLSRRSLFFYSLPSIQ